MAKDTDNIYTAGEDVGNETVDADAHKSECTCCGHRTKERDNKEYKALINRLNRIEGQIRGIRNMVENDAYCTDILIQVSAASSALNGFTKELLAEHIKGCVANDIRNGEMGTVDELVEVLKRLMK